jgi:hypothetical protein
MQDQKEPNVESHGIGYTSYRSQPSYVQSQISSSAAIAETIAADSALSYNSTRALLMGTSPQDTEMMDSVAVMNSMLAANSASASAAPYEPKTYGNAISRGNTVNNNTATVFGAANLGNVTYHHSVLPPHNTASLSSAHTMDGRSHASSTGMFLLIIANELQRILIAHH